MREPNPTPVTHQQLLDIVAQALGMQMRDYKTESRARPSVELRFLGAMMLQIYFPGIKVVEIARLFDKDHTTVISGLQRGLDLLEIRDEGFTHKYNLVLNRLETWQNQNRDT
jgi:chromosomal replication initiation ATPase DnaA